MSLLARLEVALAASIIVRLVVSWTKPSQLVCVCVCVCELVFEVVSWTKLSQLVCVCVWGLVCELVCEVVSWTKPSRLVSEIEARNRKEPTAILVKHRHHPPHQEIIKQK